MPRETKTTTPSEPTDRCKPLDEWLRGHDAVCLWERTMPRMTVQAWQIGEAVAIVQRFGKHGADGWDLYTAASRNSVADTLADAELRLGILPPSPGVEDDDRKGIVYWKQEGNDTTEDAGPADLWRADDSKHGAEVALFGGQWVSSATARRYAERYGHEFRST
jgi:hypothetical protein